MNDKSTKILTPSVLAGSITTYQAGVMQASAHRAIQKYCDDILSQFGVTKMQWLITGTILDYGNEGVTITVLAKKLSTNLPYLTNTINLLESKNVLERQPLSKTDRTKKVVVSPRFKKQCDLIEKTLRDHLRETIYSDITPEELHVYLKVTGKLAEIEPPEKE